MRDLGVVRTPDTLADNYRETPPRKKRNGAPLFFAVLWLVLIGCGIAGASWYSGRIQQQVSADLERQTASQIAVMQQDYNNRMAKMENEYNKQLAEIDGKIQALNELLTFTKDNADSKTDNSNKLYTQLAEVKKQLNELKKSMDVLK